MAKLLTVLEPCSNGYVRYCLSASRSLHSARSNQRFFHSCRKLQLAAQKAQKPSKSAKILSKSSERTNVARIKDAGVTYADMLARKPSPTLLYQAPSHGAFKFGCYSTGIFCMSWAAFNFHQGYLYPPPDIHPWIPIAFGGISFGMVCFGTYVFLGPTRIIQSITAVKPSNSALAGHPIALRIETRRILPFLRPHTLTVAPSDVSLDSRVYTFGEPISPEEERRQREKQQEIERTRILTAPFRHMSYAMWRLFVGTRRVWTQEGFLKVGIKGRNLTLKLDVTGGWALDGGKAIDRLVKMRYT